MGCYGRTSARSNGSRGRKLRRPSIHQYILCGLAGVRLASHSHRRSRPKLAIGLKLYNARVSPHFDELLKEGGHPRTANQLVTANLILLQVRHERPSFGGRPWQTYGHDCIPGRISRPNYSRYVIHNNRAARPQPARGVHYRRDRASFYGVEPLDYLS